MLLGDKKKKMNGSRFALTDLFPGRYSLRVIADPDDYYPLQTDIYVSPGGANVRTFAVQEKPTPWYGTWWFWTVTGVVVAGATAATVYFVTQQDEPLGSGTVTIR